MNNYVAGFLFGKDGDRVALIEKQRPSWQKGQLNGIGGHIERHTAECIFHNPPPCDIQNFEPCNCLGETPAEAMRREFKEETGVEVYSWIEYVILQGREFKVHFFHAYDDLVFSVKTQTDEEVNVFEVDRILNPNISYPLIPNLRWLIPMALSMIYDPHIKTYTVEWE